MQTYLPAGAFLFVTARHGDEAREFLKLSSALQPQPHYNHSRMLQRPEHWTGRTKIARRPGFPVLGCLSYPSKGYNVKGARRTAKCEERSQPTPDVSNEPAPDKAERISAKRALSTVMTIGSPPQLQRGVHIATEFMLWGRSHQGRQLGGSQVDWGSPGPPSHRAWEQRQCRVISAASWGPTGLAPSRPGG